MTPRQKLDELFAADPDGTRDMMLKQVFVTVTELDAAVEVLTVVIGVIAAEVGVDMDELAFRIRFAEKRMTSK